MSSAETGRQRRLRFGLRGEYAAASDLVVEGDENLRLMGGFTLSYTPLPRLELFGGLSGSSNRNRRPAGERNRVDPEVIRTFGDLQLGGKFAAPVARSLRFGVEGGVRLLTSNSGVSFDPSATSLFVAGLATLDLDEALELPLRLHANAGFVLDNSKQLEDFSEVQSLRSRSVAAFAYGIQRSRVRAALGLEAPLPEIGEIDLTLLPFFEYHVEYVTADADPAYATYQSPSCRGSVSSPIRGSSPCSENRDLHWLTMGLRAQVGGGLSADLGFDVALRSPGFPYGPALVPFNVIFGLVYPFDVGGPKVVTRTITVEKVVEPDPREGFVSGRVVATSGAPLGGAIVEVQGQRGSRVATDPDGSFTTKALPPGPISLQISAPGHRTASAQASVLVGQTAQVAVTLEADVTPGRVNGRVVDEAGRPAVATISFDGPDKAEVTTDPAGSFEVSLTPGSYVARSEVARSGRTELPFELLPGADRSIELRLTGGDRKLAQISGGVSAPAAPSLIVVQAGRLILRRPVTFRTNGNVPTAEIAAAALPVIDQVAAALAAHPEIRRLRVEAHWDGGLGGDEASALTARQAEAIAEQLTKRGIARDRVEPIGRGASQPLVPNIGPTARAKNRRVEFVVVD